MNKLIPNQYGNYPCPYCKRILTPIFSVWLNKVTVYVCHKCQKGFGIKYERKGITEFN